MGWGEPPAKAVEEQVGWGEAPAVAVKEQMGWGEPAAEAAQEAWGADTGPRHSERQHTAGGGHDGEHNKGGSDPGSGNDYSSYAAFEPPAILTREERLAKIKAAMAKVGTIPTRKALLENANKVRLTACPYLGAVYLTTLLLGAVETCMQHRLRGRAHSSCCVCCVGEAQQCRSSAHLRSAIVAEG